MMNRRYSMRAKGLYVAAVLLVFAVLISASTGNGGIAPNARSVADSFQPEHVRADLRFLADDLLEGRGTGSRGGDIAAAYIASQFQIAGLRPLGDNGTYFQRVPLIGVNTQPESTMSITPQNGSAMPLNFQD